MSELFKVLGTARLKPAAPPNTQVIACPAGYTGPGQTQTRTVTWDVASQSWVTGVWNTTEFNCTIDAFTFVGPDTTELANTGIYDHTLTANGHTARIKATWYGKTIGIGYEVWAPTLAGRLCRPHWKAEPPSYKGPESNWQDYQPLSEAGYMVVFPPRLEQEYGYGPYHNLKGGELNGCNIDIK